MGPISLLLLLHAVACYASYYRTEPIFLPELFNVSHVTQHRSRLAPGYLFIEPLLPKPSWGPQIYTQDGVLIYSGGDIRVQDFKRCDYLGEEGNHLCYHQSRFTKGSSWRGLWGKIVPHSPRPVGRKIVLDNTYTQVGWNYSKGIGDGREKDWPNGHEYNMLKGGRSFLQAVYNPKPWDLRPWLGPEDGYIIDGCFQEVNVDKGDVHFQWCYSDHLDIGESNLYFNISETHPNDTRGVEVSVKAGSGTIRNPWDFIHLNAVDKTSEGDYLVSGRHTDQILKVAGPNNIHGMEPGKLIWRVGGKSSDFELVDGLLFTKQHDVRHIKTTAEETTMSFYNNAWEGTNDPSANRSAGMIIAVNNVTMKARLLHEYVHPDGILGRAMGSMQILPNGNAFVGWGAAPQLTEFSEDGEPLWHAWYNRPGFEKGQHPHIMHEWTYRAYKFPWAGNPHWDPKLVAYSRSCNPAVSKRLMAFASWNGATNVDSWRFYVSWEESGPWNETTTVRKDGFETQAVLSGPVHNEAPRYVPWVAVEALDRQGKILGRTHSRTFVPKRSILEHCDHFGCYHGPKYFEYSAANRCDCPCSFKMERRNWLGLALTLMIIEGASFMMGMFSRIPVDADSMGRDGPLWHANGSGAKRAPHKLPGTDSGFGVLEKAAKAPSRLISFASRASIRLVS